MSRRVSGSAAPGCSGRRSMVPGLVRDHAYLGVEPGPALGADIALKRGADFMLGFRAKFDRYKLLGAGAQAAADVVAGDHEVIAGVIDAAHQKMEMRIVGVPVVYGNPIEPGPKVGFHLPREVSREGPEIGHLGSVFGRDDEAEVVPVILRSIGKSGIVGAVGFVIEHARLLAVARHALALQIGDMRRYWRGAEGAALHDARRGLSPRRGGWPHEQPVAAEREPPAPERRAAKAGRLARTGLRSGMARPLRGAQHLVDEALGLAGARAADAARDERGNPRRSRSSAESGGWKVDSAANCH